jgi:DNA repair protein RadA
MEIMAKEIIELDESPDSNVEVQEIVKPKKKTKKEKQDLEKPTSIFLKEYVGSGAGIGELSYKKLEAVGVTTVYDVLIRGSNEIKNFTDMEDSRIHKLFKICTKVLENSKRTRSPKLKVSELRKYRANMKKIPSGNIEIDDMLGGGIELEALTEVYGAFASGKTQFCYTILVEAMFRYGWKAVWIDCEDTFDPARLHQIIRARGYAEDKTDDELDEIIDGKLSYTHTPNTDSVVEEVSNLSPRLVEDETVKLIIIDGATGQFREEYLGRGTLASRQQNLAKFMGVLKNSAYFFNVAVLMTNQVLSDPSQSYGDPIRPVGGHIVGHASTYRLYFKKAGKKRYATAVDSPKQAVFDAEFTLTDKGIDNP